LIKLSRPLDWVKNVFILMPVPFALATGATLDVQRFALGMLAFCLANSAAYSFNDARDAPLDREHPLKRDRPVASGRVSPSAAYAWSTALALCSIAIGVLLGSAIAAGIIVAYLVLNAAYSQGGKHIPLVDVFLLSSGFVLRVFFGCALLAVTPSNWLLLCTSALALFLSLTKRRGDLVLGMDEAQRPSLAGYNVAFLDQGMGITAGVAMVSYALYSIEAQVFVDGRELASLPFVAYAVLNYLRLAHTEGKGISPVDMATREPSFLLASLGWAAAAAWSLGAL
jgi:4-hydroxybenzoate polyprenyltransferase